MDKNEVIEKLKKYKVLLEKNFDLYKLYLYGSYATDNFQQDSDIDVAVIVNSVEGDFFSVNPLLWKLRREVDDRIEPILLEKDKDNSGFFNIIQKQGIEII